MRKTRTSIISSLLVCGLVAAVGMAVFELPARQNVGRNHDGTVHLSVKFEPHVVKQPVQLRVSIDGTPLPLDPPQTFLSPWSRSIMATPDAIISFRVFMPEGEKLDCFISRAGRPSAMESREGPGGVHCLSHGT